MMWKILKMLFWWKDFFFSILSIIFLWIMPGNLKATVIFFSHCNPPYFGCFASEQWEGRSFLHAKHSSGGRGQGTLPLRLTQHWSSSGKQAKTLKPSTPFSVLQSLIVEWCPLALPDEGGFQVRSSGAVSRRSRASTSQRGSQMWSL